MNYDEQRKLALKIFRGRKFAGLRKAIKKGHCFRELLKIANEKETLKLWDYFLDEWKYKAGIYWEGVTDEMRIEAFPKLKNEWKFEAGKYWKGITNGMRIEEFPTLESEWKFQAGRDWDGINNEMREKGE